MSFSYMYVYCAPRSEAWDFNVCFMFVTGESFGPEVIHNVHGTAGESIISTSRDEWSIELSISEIISAYLMKRIIPIIARK